SDDHLGLAAKLPRAHGLFDKLFKLSRQADGDSHAEKLAAQRQGVKLANAEPHWRRHLHRLLRFSRHECQNPLLLFLVPERMKRANFIDPAGAVERVEEERVAFCELASFQVAAAQVRVVVGAGTLAGEEMEAQPAAIGARDLLRAAKEGDEEEQDE